MTETEKNLYLIKLALFESGTKPERKGYEDWRLTENGAHEGKMFASPPLPRHFSGVQKVTA
eukprot:3772736-Rhodomonas_salina.1